MGASLGTNNLAGADVPAPPNPKIKSHKDFRESGRISEKLEVAIAPISG
jgi:hypothetical protein